MSNVLVNLQRSHDIFLRLFNEIKYHILQIGYVDAYVMISITKLSVNMGYFVFLLFIYLKKLLERTICELKKINKRIFRVTFLKTMLNSNGFGIILTYAGRIIKTGKAEISHRRTIEH